MSTMLLASSLGEALDYVLVVADDPFLRKLLRRQLEGKGLAVQEALSVSRGVARVRVAPPSLVLLDLWVERGAGLGFIEDVRACGWPELPVLLVGAEPRSEVLIRAFELGAVGAVPLGAITSIGDWVDAALREPGAPAEDEAAT